MSSPDEEALRKMSYSELRKQALKHGIRKSMKAEKIISSILSKKEADEDSFVTMERKIINSCKKNKERLFEEDKKAVSDTPRRETYTVDDPLTDIENKKLVFEEDKKAVSDTPRRETYSVDDPLTDIEVIKASIVATSASPALKESNKSLIENDKTAPESTQKNRKSKRKVSFVTPVRRSARLFGATPQYNSLKGRPKTPIPNRSSSSKRMSSKGNKSEVAGSLNLDSSVNGIKISSGGNVKRPSTPMPAKQKRKRLSSLDYSDGTLSPNLKSVIEIEPVLQELEEETCDETPSKSFYATPKASSDVKREKINSSKDSVSKKEKSATPSSSTMTVKSALKTSAMTSKQTVSSKKVKTMTPGLKKTTPLPIIKTLITPGFKPIKTPLSKSKNTMIRSAVKFGMSSSASKKASTPITGLKSISTPGLSALKKKATPITRKKLISTPGQSLSAMKNNATPVSGKKLISTPGLSLSAIKNATPNFSKIHQKAFDKMESIEDYQKRRALNSAKKLKEQRKYHAPSNSNINKEVASENIKKIPKTFAGIPFVPSVASKTKIMKRNTQKPTGLNTKKSTTKSAPSNGSSLTQKLIKSGNMKAIKSAAKENTPLKQRQKFDLRASLAKKLPYKPHTGRIKPLNEPNFNGNISTTLPPAKKVQNTPAAKKAQDENQVVSNSRIETRDVLRGVRKNKRFLLQMSNRNLSMQL